MAEDTMSYANRDEVPERYRWDLSSLFEDDDAFEAALAAARDLPDRYAAWESRALESGENLLAFLRFDDEATLRVQRLWNYAGRRADEDTRKGHYQDLNSQVTTFVTKVGAAAAWFRPAILALDARTLDGWYDTTPGLDLYRLALDRITAQRDHVLPQAQEALLAQAGEMAAQPGLIFTMLNDADLRFPDACDAEGAAHPVTHGSFVPLEMSPDRTLRESAYHSMYASYRAVKNASAATLAAQMRELEFFADARHYENSLEASLAPTEVPVSVYENLIASVRRNLDPLHRFMAMRRDALGLSEMRYWDVYAPAFPAPTADYTFEEASELMLRALAPLGEDYVATVREGLEKRWIDVFETPGKMSGAYSADGHGMNPLILLNYQGTLDDVFTLVHEMGHAMQTWLSNHAQPARYAEYPMFVAEVASTTNECLLMRYLLASETDGARRAFLLDHFCEQFRTTLYRQTLFAEFERDANEACARGVGLGADDLSVRYRALNDEYYGPVVQSDDDIALEWARIPHFYYDYYVYVYATSFAAAVAISERILTRGKPAVDDYLAFLSGGCSKSPIDLLRGAGVDMSTGEPVDEALAVFARMVGELESQVSSS